MHAAKYAYFHLFHICRVQVVLEANRGMPHNRKNYILHTWIQISLEFVSSDSTDNLSTLSHIKVWAGYVTSHQMN